MKQKIPYRAASFVLLIVFIGSFLLIMKQSIQLPPTPSPTPTATYQPTEVSLATPTEKTALIAWERIDWGTPNEYQTVGNFWFPSEIGMMRFKTPEWQASDYEGDEWQSGVTVTVDDSDPLTAICGYTEALQTTGSRALECTVTDGATTKGFLLEDGVFNIELRYGDQLGWLSFNGLQIKLTIAE